MSLEEVFRAKLAIGRLRSGPLGQMLEEFCDWLLRGGFSECSIRRHVANMSHLGEYLGGPASPVRATVAPADIEEFLESYPRWCQNRGPLEDHLLRMRQSVNRFTRFLIQQGILGDALPTDAPLYQPLLDAYLAWMRDYHHLAASSLNGCRLGVDRFLCWLGPEATLKGVSRLTAERIEAFCVVHAQRMGISARRTLHSSLRSFLRFCLHEGHVTERLDQAVPTLRSYKLATVPRGLTEIQAQAVLDAIDRQTDTGRRDYAILQLLHTYGVRGGQVRALRLEDIRWADEEILFVAMKNGKDSLLPLTADVGDSLLDYLENVRPQCRFREVFLTRQAPIRPLPDSSWLSHIVRWRIKAAGVDVACNGSHVFRHGFATRMVNAGYSFKAIADVLGHRWLPTTFIYAKVDFRALKQVPLDWPEEVAS